LISVAGVNVHSFLSTYTLYQYFVSKVLPDLEKEYTSSDFKACMDYKFETHSLYSSFIYFTKMFTYIAEIHVLGQLYIIN